MDAVKYLRDLFSYNSWADETIWKTVLSSSDAYKSHEIKKLLHHIHTVQLAFYQLWIDAPLDLSKRNDIPEDIAKIKQLAKIFNTQALNFAEALDETSLEKIINIPWSIYVERHLGKKPAEATLADTIIQVVNHSTYHRGQVNKLLRQIDTEPPLIDYIAWVWFEKPEASWP